jgi:hypothetical protein
MWVKTDIDFKGLLYLVSYINYVMFRFVLLQISKIIKYLRISIQCYIYNVLNDKDFCHFYLIGYARA